MAAVAFFELCFTARAGYSYRLARGANGTPAGAKDTPAEHQQLRPAIFTTKRDPIFNRSDYSCLRLVLMIAIAALLLVISLIDVESPSGHSLQREGAVERTVLQVASGKGMEPPSSRAAGETMAFVGCILAAIMIVGTIVKKNLKSKI